MSGHAGPAADASVAGLFLLLVEDDLGDAVLVREYLVDGDLDARLDHVGTLTEAMAVGYEPDCVLLDLHLPDGQGLDALRRVLRRWQHAAVLVLTGLNDAATGSAAVAAGAQDYLVKDQVDAAVLARTIRYAVQRKRVQTAERTLRDSRLQAEENTRLQRGLLPKPLLNGTAVTVASRYLPGQQRSLLGGDFYDVVQTPDGMVHALIGDVCGNGPDEAAMGVGLRYGWRTLTLAGLRKVDRMRLLEQVLVAERPHDGMFATVCTVGVNPATGEVIVLSAGHPAPLIVTPGHVYPAPVRYGPGLGMAPGRARWQESTITVPAGAGLLLYTDGVIESFCADGTRLGEDRFIDLAAGLTTIEDPDQYVDALLARIQNADAGRHTDDTAVLYLRCPA
ncbi:serine phosphatase RsbU (regulator of sigma subunit) [Actinoplanes octamycinicus]|uniref:Serine phosphatase RsbU (Regulator of sigma subunit) n=1 Tax=Actinoplanes octamycinicus TaxID=135948 RepID=A0A7W7H1N2_9ACTN|nr:fused response regulator/phosphatase [Actinoplanes octamycinicus]MBB4742253.1 serine phosphatase RsbU (regulator of sigma subunit) [Actinoplanes octamycinicus]GIE59902.1 fused response regulator/phosphatase [Actinoplanes octamycinicus]